MDLRGNQMSDREAWEFRVLGPLEVWRGGPSIVLGAPKQRVLLAALILRANRVVAADTLVELLWDDHPPATARNTLHTLVRRLRRALAAADAAETSDPADEMLVTRSSGYRLRIVDPDDSDLAKFERLTAEGRRMLSRAPECAASLLRQGLSLWRGSPLADIESEWLQRVEIPRLVEQRLTAIEDRVMADLMCGRHAELIAELRALTAAHPLRPRLLGQLMLALHRSGRQAEALTTYRSARDAMTEELGLEPTVELQQLQQAILEADASLEMGEQAATGDALPLVPGVVQAPGPPHQLPQDAAVFVGRDNELAWLMRRMMPRQSARQPAIAVVSGEAGGGKSTLAIHAAHYLADHFSDGQLFADLHGVRRGEDAMSPLHVLPQFLRALGVAHADVPASVDEAGARFRSLTASKRILVVLDDAGSAEQVGHLLPAGPGCAALITSRQALSGRENAPHMHLSVLSVDDAIELLRRLAGRQRIDDEPEAARALAELCASLPIALRIAAERLALRPAWTVRALVERLAKPRRRLDELVLGSVSVRSCLQASYIALPADDARLFRMLGLLNGTEVSVGQVATLLQQDSDHVEIGLERLVDLALLRSAAPGTYSFNELSRLFAREKAVRAKLAPCSDDVE